jgi:AraC family transcriptional regulator, transcriptional activator of the genes for pyochelin and ferripyochelin receptors
MPEAFKSTPPQIGDQTPFLHQESSISLAEGTLWLREGQLPNIRFRHIKGSFQAEQPLQHLLRDNVVTMLFVLNGRVRIENPTANISIECGKQLYNTIYQKEKSTIVIAEEREIEWMLVEWELGAFLDMAEGLSTPWTEFADKVKAETPAILFQETIYYDLRIQAILQSLLQSDVEAQQQRIFFHAKAIELMALQADCWQKSLSPKPVYAKNEYDRERLFFAKEFLLQHMATPPTLAELARIAGINEFKLKRGFKELFGNTVFGYLAEARLALAKSELLTDQKTATEIAFDLGYSSLQHFSTAFKKKYGVSPTELARE